MSNNGQKSLPLLLEATTSTTNRRFGIDPNDLAQMSGISCWAKLKFYAFRLIIDIGVTPLGFISHEKTKQNLRCSTRDSWFQQLLLSCCSREIARSFIKDEIIWSMTDRRKWYYHELVSLACCSDVLLMQKFSEQRRPSFYSHYDQNLVWKWAFGVFYATHKLLGVQVDQHVKYSSVVALEFYKLLAISRILKRH